MSEETLVTGTETNDPGVTADADGATKTEGTGDATKTQVEDATKNADGTDKTDGDKPAEVPEKYEFKVPEGMVLDEAKAEAFTKIAKDAKLSQAAVDALVEMHVKDVTSQAETHKSTVQGWVAETKALKDLGGDNLPKTIALANKAVDLGPPELKGFLKESGLGNHPLFVKWAHAVGKALSVDKHVPGDTPSSASTAADTLYGGTK